MSPRGQATLLIPLAVCAACGEDPVSYSTPVGISLKARSAATAGGVVVDEKSIKSESGNPYGAFVGRARAQIGRDPALIDVERVELRLGDGSSGVTTLGEVFAGTVEVMFQMEPTNVTYPVAAGTIDAGSGAGPVALDIVFAADAVPDSDYVKLLLGNFKLAARGPAAPTFEVKGAEADLQVMVTFAAFE